ncbi:hypothetical protein B0H13DRAFT_1887365 [Mycena leptocephala]|nr:hypothetical protein B0H13DRAFT_1887365 [Mycena leptocephala]
MTGEKATMPIYSRQRQTNNIRRTKEVITARAVQKFRYVLFGQLMKLEMAPIEPGVNEECENDSDYPSEISPPMSENGDRMELEVSSRSPENLFGSSIMSSWTPTSIPSPEIAPPVLPRRSERNAKKLEPK